MEKITGNSAKFVADADWFARMKHTISMKNI
jgi:hypothetical protein